MCEGKDPTQRHPRGARGLFARRLMNRGAPYPAAFSICMGSFLQVFFSSKRGRVALVKQPPLFLNLPPRYPTCGGGTGVEGNEFIDAPPPSNLPLVFEKWKVFDSIRTIEPLQMHTYSTGSLSSRVISHKSAKSFCEVSISTPPPPLFTLCYHRNRVKSQPNQFHLLMLQAGWEDDEATIFIMWAVFVFL